MDVNYSRWMSKDPDAEPDVIEDEPRRFNLRWPTWSAVASTAMVSLIVLGGGAFVRSIATPEVTTDQAETVETPAAEQSSGADAVSVDDSSDDSTSEDPMSDDSTSDNVADYGTTRDRPARIGPRLMARRELRRSDGMPPGRPWRDRPPRGDSTRPALPPPMHRP